MTGPLLLIALGILFLLNNLFPEFRLSRMWPVILIVVGLSRIIDYFHMKGRGSEPPVSRKEGE